MFVSFAPRFPVAGGFPFGFGVGTSGLWYLFATSRPPSRHRRLATIARIFLMDADGGQAKLARKIQQRLIKRIPERNHLPLIEPFDFEKEDHRFRLPRYATCAP
jgi:hypothetical protein